MSFQDLPYTIRVKIYSYLGLVRPCPIELNRPDGYDPRFYNHSGEAALPGLSVQGEYCLYVIRKNGGDRYCWYHRPIAIGIWYPFLGCKFSCSLFLDKLRGKPSYIGNRHSTYFPNRPSAHDGEFPKSRVATGIESQGSTILIVYVLSYQLSCSVSLATFMRILSRYFIRKTGSYFELKLPLILVYS